MKLASCKNAKPPAPTPVVYFTDSSEAVIPVLVLLFVVCGLFYEAIYFVS